MADDKYKPKSAPNGGQTKLRDWWDDVVEKNFSDIYGYFCKHIAGTADRHTADMIDYADGQDGTVKEKLDEKADKEDIGSLDDLQTADKSTIVAAINALFAESVKEIDRDEMDYAVQSGIYRVKTSGVSNDCYEGYLLVWDYDFPGPILGGGTGRCRQLLFTNCGVSGGEIEILVRYGGISDTNTITAEWISLLSQDFLGENLCLGGYAMLYSGGLIPKERLGNEDGGFAAGAGASAQGSSGAAIGKGATSQAAGSAVGENAWADTGAAIGKNAFCAGNGGAVGVSASAVHGFAGGGNAKVVWSGGAVGSGAYAGNGFSGGLNAKVEDTEDGPVDAIQLGAGTNSTPKTLQVYDYQLMDAEGHIPKERLKDIPLFHAPGNQLYVDSATRQMLADVNSYRFVDASPPDDVLMAFTTPSFTAYIQNQQVTVPAMSALWYTSSRYIYIIQEADGEFSLYSKPVSSGYIQASELQAGKQLVAAIGKVDFAVPPVPNLEFWETIQTAGSLADFGISEETNFPVTARIITSEEVLTKTNTIPYTPTMPYHPATKAYVDAHSGGGGSGGGSNRNYALHSKEDIPASRQAGDIFFIWDGFDSTTPIDPPEQTMQAVQYTNMVISEDEPENAEYWGKIVSESKEGASDIPVSDIVSGDMEVAEEPSGTKIFFNKIK